MSDSEGPGFSSDETRSTWWYNLTTGAVEHGMQSQSKDRVGPFDSEDAAAHALDTLRANSEKWAADDAADD